MSRREVRIHAFKILFQLKFYKAPVVIEKLELYFTNMKVEDEKGKVEILEFVNGVVDNLENIDKVINSHMKGWKTNRMPSADLAILRIATFEMLYSDLSIKIIANEAVELAKKYSTAESPVFVNAIIGQINKDL